MGSPEYIGRHNERLTEARSRLIQGGSYRDLSTICVIPTRGVLYPRVVQSWFGLMSPMNQKFVRLMIEKMEVGEAYSTIIEQILADPFLSAFKYVLTLEEDNMPPPDGLIKLYEGMKDYDAVGGLYWTKGEGGMPMIYGDPKIMPRNFVPQLPQPDTLQECNGLGMGFTLFRLEMFRHADIGKPFFKTVQEWDPNIGAKAYTQDLHFFERAAKCGFKFACDTRVKVGHYDPQTEEVW